MSMRHCIPSGYPCGSAADWTSSDLGGESSCHGDVELLGAAESSKSLLHLKERRHALTEMLWGGKEESLLGVMVFKSHNPFIK